jgi:1,4-alpha-glucan branching enzyme
MTNGRSIRLSQLLISFFVFFAVVSKPISSDAAFSTRPGMGSIPYADSGDTGVTFRVWAPNATSVTVKGTFNIFSTTANPLFSEGTNGLWSVDVSGAHIGQQYKYYLNGSTDKQDPRGRQETSSVGNSLIYDPSIFDWTGDNFTYVPQNDAVIYELNIGTFNDTSPGSGGPGTFTTAINRLPYLKELGISAVEVMPINEFPGDYSWGYNPSDLFGIESAFGGPNGFKTFVKTCHQFGIGVLVDVVHNHYGPTDLDLWRYDGSFSGPYGGIYFYQAAGLCCTPWGNTRPNYSSQQVRNFIQDTFTMFLDEYHVDGFRWDSPYYMMNSDAGFNTDAQTLIQQCSTMIHTGYVGKLNIGESEGWLSGTAGFDSTWYASPFQNHVVSQLTPSSDAARNMGSINYAVNVNHNGGGAPGWGNVFFMETHDSAGDLNGGQRLPVKIDGSNPTSYYARKRSTLGAAITLTAPGIPMILQGEEMLTTTQFGADEAEALDWSRTNTYSGIVSLYTDLIHLRRNLDGRSSGLTGWNVFTMWTDNSNKLIAYRRWDTGATGDDVVVIANFANTTWPSYDVPNFPKSGTWYTLVNSDSTKYSSDYGDYGPTSIVVTGSTGTISIAPYSVLIFSQVPPPEPVANFTASPTTGMELLAVTFIDTSTGTITNRFWDFGDGGTTNVTTNTVVHTYAAGTNTVTLIVSGPSGVGTNVQPDYVVVSPYVPTPFENWQVQYFGTTNNPDAASSADPDGDGQNNMAEFTSGTNPTNNASAFRITSITPEGNNIRITWMTAGGKTNVVQAGAGDFNVGNPAYTNLFFDMSGLIAISGTGTVVTNFLEDSTWWGDYSNWPAHYYRIRVVP